MTLFIKLFFVHDGCWKLNVQRNSFWHRRAVSGFSAAVSTRYLTCSIITTTARADVDAVALIVRFVSPSAFELKPFFSSAASRRGSPRKVYRSPTTSRLQSQFPCLSLACYRSPSVSDAHSAGPSPPPLANKPVNRLLQWSMSHCLAHLQPVNSSPRTGCSQLVPRGSPDSCY